MIIQITEINSLRKDKGCTLRDQIRNNDICKSQGKDMFSEQQNAGNTIDVEATHRTNARRNNRQHVIKYKSKEKGA